MKKKRIQKRVFVKKKVSEREIDRIKLYFLMVETTKKKKKKYATRTCPTFRKARRNFAEVLLVIS